MWFLGAVFVCDGWHVLFHGCSKVWHGLMCGMWGVVWCEEVCAVSVYYVVRWCVSGNVLCCGGLCMFVVFVVAAVVCDEY